MPTALSDCHAAVWPTPSVSENSARSLRLIGCPLSSLTVTASRFVPRLEIVSVTVLVAPFTRLTRMTSAMTPMMMPSIVRNARSLFPLIDFIAMRRDCFRVSIMRPPQ